MAEEFGRRPIWRWIIPVCVGLILFANHYPRDVVGALERQFEFQHLLSPRQYTAVNACYFFPNIFLPILVGQLIPWLGGINASFLLTLFISSIGHTLFACGGYLDSFALMLIGRGLAGTMYEVIDALMPMVYLSKQFKSEWSITIGILTLLMRSGSIFNFILTPIILEQLSLVAALWVAAGVSCIGCIAMIIAWLVEIQWRRSNDACYEKLPTVEDVKLQAEEDQIDEATSSKEHQQHQLSEVFWLYMLVGVFVYGLIIPFWFLGSKYLQVSYRISVSLADALIVVPEAVIMLLAIPVAFLTQPWTLSSKMTAISCAGLSIAMTYILLVWSAESAAARAGGTSSESAPLVQPMFVVLSLGLSFTIATSVFWGSFAQALGKQGDDQRTVARASGLLSCAVNILPSILPPTLAALFGSEALGSFILCLAAVAAVAAIIAALVAAVSFKTEKSLQAKGSISSSNSAACDNSDK
jgi:MFS family permease